MTLEFITTSKRLHCSGLESLEQEVSRGNPFESLDEVFCSTYTSCGIIWNSNELKLPQEVQTGDVGGMFTSDVKRGAPNFLYL